MAELGYAIGLQGRPKDYSGALAAAQQNKYLREAAKKRGEEEDFNKFLGDIDIKWDKYHRTDQDPAKRMMASFVDKAYQKRQSGDPNWRNGLLLEKNELIAGLNELQNISSKKFDYEKAYAGNKIFRGKSEENYYRYLLGNDRSYLARANPNIFGSLEVVNPDTGDITYTEYNPVDVGEIARKNIHISQGKDYARDAKGNVISYGLGGGNQSIKEIDVFDDNISRGALRGLMAADSDFTRSLFATRENELVDRVRKQTGIDIRNQDPQDWQQNPEVAKAVEDFAWETVLPYRKGTEDFKILPKGQTININTGASTPDTTNANEMKVVVRRDQAGNEIESATIFGKASEKLKDYYGITPAGITDISGKPVTDKNMAGGLQWQLVASVPVSVSTKNGKEVYGKIVPDGYVTEENIKDGTIKYINVAIANKYQKVGEEKFEDIDPVYVPLENLLGAQAEGKSASKYWDIPIEQIYQTTEQKNKNYKTKRPYSY